MRSKAFPIFCSPVSHSALFIRHTLHERGKKHQQPQINCEAPRIICSSGRSFRVKWTEIHFRRCKVKVSPLDTCDPWQSFAERRRRHPRQPPHDTSVHASWPNIKVKCMRLEVCNILSTIPEWPTGWKRNRTERNRVRWQKRNEGKLRAEACHARWFLWFQHKPMLVHQSWVAGLHISWWVCACVCVWACFGCHSVATLPATNRRNVRCLLHLTRTFFAHPTNQPPTIHHPLASTLWSVLCNCDHQSVTLDTALKI